MDTQVVVPLTTLRTAFTLLLEHVEALVGPEVRLDKDYFWTISPEQAYDVYHSPQDFTIGQLSECVDHLTTITVDPSRATSFALVWLGELSKAIGQAVTQ